MTESLTYAKARNFTGTTLGSNTCPVPDDQIEVLMVNCLRRMHADLSDDKHYQTEVELELVDGQCEYNLGEIGLRKFTRVEDDNCNELDYCASPPTREEKGLKKQQAYTKCYGACDCCDPCPEPQKPTSWTCYGGNLIVWPVPKLDYGQTCTIHLRGERALDCTLYTIEDGIKVWKTVDLPPNYHSVYAKCLLAMALAACDDLERANWWLQIARDELEAIKCLDDEPIFESDTKGENICCLNGDITEHKCGDRLNWEFEDVDGRVEVCCGG